MSIIRAPRPASNFYVLDKAISENSRLGWAARGLLIFILGKPDHWRVSVEHLRKQTEGARIRTGRDGVYALLKELEAAGYMRAVQRRSADGKGFGSVDYEVSETVLPADPETGCDVLPGHADTPEADTPEPTLARTERTARTNSQGKLEEVAPTRTDGRHALDVPPDLDLDPMLVADFERHCREVGKALTGPGWSAVVHRLRELHADGVDLNESLRVTMTQRYVIPCDPTKGKRGRISRRQRKQQSRVDADVRVAERTMPPSRPDREGAWTC